MYIIDDVLDLMDSLGETLEKSKRGRSASFEGRAVSALSSYAVILALALLSLRLCSYSFHRARKQAGP